MANVTNTVESILAMAIKHLSPNLDSVRAELESHNAQFDKYKHIAKLDNNAQSTGWDNAHEQFMAMLHAAKRNKNSEQAKFAQSKLDSIAEYETWKFKREELENAVNAGIVPLRELVVGLNAVTGDETIHKTHNRGGNKIGANGERINHGNMCQIVRISDNSIVTYDENGNKCEIWKSINNACKTLTPRKIDENTGEEKPYINQNAKACERALAKYGYAVKFLAQDS